MNEIQENVINRFVQLYGEPDRKEEKLIRETTIWALQEYHASESFKQWINFAKFMGDTSNMTKPIWWLKFLRTTINIAIYFSIVYLVYKMVVHVF